MSRKAPRDVPPVELNGVRFEQVMSPGPYEMDNNSRYLRASRIADGETLWIVPVFTMHIDPSKSRGPQSVYFASLSLFKGKLVIGDEQGRWWQVDPESGKVKKLWWKPLGLK